MNEPAPLELTVVIPAYNEAGRIRDTLEAVARYLAASRIAHEVLVVDDGSTDATTTVVAELAAALPAIRILPGDHRGKGAAVKRGMLAARGAYVLFMDADHSTRIEEWSKCRGWLLQGYDVVIGSRKMPGARIERSQPRLREGLGKVFTWLANRLVVLAVTDVTCGFKCFSAAAVRAVFPLQRLDGWGFDAEILYIARCRGQRIKEVPVVWADDSATRVHLLADSARSLADLLSIRWASLRGLYR